MRNTPQEIKCNLLLFIFIHFYLNIFYNLIFMILSFLFSFISFFYFLFSNFSFYTYYIFVFLGRDMMKTNGLGQCKYIKPNYLLVRQNVIFGFFLNNAKNKIFVKMVWERNKLSIWCGFPIRLDQCELQFAQKHATSIYGGSNGHKSPELTVRPSSSMCGGLNPC